MVPSLIKNAIQIKLGFSSLPILVDEMEAACAIGIGYRIMGQPVPEKQDSLSVMQENFIQTAEAHMDLTDERNQRLLTLIKRFQPAKPVDDRLYQFMLYGADQIPEFEA